MMSIKNVSYGGLLVGLLLMILAIFMNNSSAVYIYKLGFLEILIVLTLLIAFNVRKMIKIYNKKKELELLKNNYEIIMRKLSDLYLECFDKDLDNFHIETKKISLKEIMLLLLTKENTMELSLFLLSIGVYFFVRNNVYTIDSLIINILMWISYCIICILLISILIKWEKVLSKDDKNYKSRIEFYKQQLQEVTKFYESLMILKQTE